MSSCDSRHLRRDTVHFSGPEYVDQPMIRDISRVTWVGVWVNIVLAVLKGAGGILSGSKVLLADAVHTVSDLATDAAILIGVRYWSAPADAHHPHGHRKIETLITMAIGVALAMVGLGMGYDAVARLVGALGDGSREAALTGREAAVWVGFAAAVASIVAKELLYRWTARKGVALGSSAVVANAWHHRSDAISSIPAVLAIGGEELGAHMGYNLWYLDPLGTVVVCFMLLQAAWEVVQPTLGALLDASADRKICSAIRKTVLSTNGVIDTHRIRTRVICSNAVAVDLHITVDKHLSVERGHAIAMDVRNHILALRPTDSVRAVDVLVHVEPGDPREQRLPGSDRDTMVDWKQL